MASPDFCFHCSTHRSHIFYSLVRCPPPIALKKTDFNSSVNAGSPYSCGTLAPKTLSYPYRDCSGKPRNHKWDICLAWSSWAKCKQYCETRIQNWPCWNGMRWEFLHLYTIKKRGSVCNVKIFWACHWTYHMDWRPNTLIPDVNLKCRGSEVQCCYLIPLRQTTISSTKINFATSVFLKLQVLYMEKVHALVKLKTSPVAMRYQDQIR